MRIRTLTTIEGSPCVQCAGTTRYAKSKQCVPCSRRAARERQRAIPIEAKRLRQRLHNLKRYNLTPDQYDTLFALQGGVCAICKTSDPAHKLKWHVDHDHSNGAVRGIVCGHCNAGLGYFRDSIENLKAAIAYLQEDVQPARVMFAREIEWLISTQKDHTK